MRELTLHLEPKGFELMMKFLVLIEISESWSINLF